MFSKYDGFSKEEKQAARNNLTGVRVLLKMGRGWVKGVSKTYSGPTRYCLSGAISEVSIGEYLAADALRDAIAHYGVKHGYRSRNIIGNGSIIHFNDSRKTKWRDISRVLANARRRIK